MADTRRGKRAWSDDDRPRGVAGAAGRHAPDGTARARGSGAEEVREAHPDRGRAAAWWPRVAGCRSAERRPNDEAAGRAGDRVRRGVGSRRSLRRLDQWRVAVEVDRVAFVFVGGERPLVGAFMPGNGTGMPMPSIVSVNVVGRASREVDVRSIDAVGARGMGVRHRRSTQEQLHREHDRNGHAHRISC